MIDDGRGVVCGARGNEGRAQAERVGLGLGLSLDQARIGVERVQSELMVIGRNNLVSISIHLKLRLHP